MEFPPWCHINSTEHLRKKIHVFRKYIALNLSWFSNSLDLFAIFSSLKQAIQFDYFPLFCESSKPVVLNLQPRGQIQLAEPCLLSSLEIWWWGSCGRPNSLSWMIWSDKLDCIGTWRSPYMGSLCGRIWWPGWHRIRFACGWIQCAGSRWHVAGCSRCARSSQHTAGCSVWGSAKCTAGSGIQGWACQITLHVETGPWTDSIPCVWPALPSIWAPLVWTLYIFVIISK